MNTSTHNEDARFLELLRKWQTGDFTRADEVEINALASGDAFRRETLDGFLDLPEQDHRATLDALSKKIRGKGAKRLMLPQIWALAAALALIFGAIWFFNIRPIPNDSEKVAQDMPMPVDNQQEQLPAGNSAPPPPEISQPPQRPAPAASSPALDKVAETKDLSEPDRMNEDAKAGQVDDMAAAETKRSEPEQRPGAPVEQSTNVALPREQAKEAASRAKKLDQAAKPVPTYDEENADKKKAAKSQPATSMPLGGWDSFRLYLNTSARLTPEALAHNVTGTVRLQFRLNNKNQPVDFKILNSLGYGCDEAAIKLVKDFAWAPGSNDIIRVDVPFVR